MSDELKNDIKIEKTGEAEGRIMIGDNRKPITVIGTDKIRDELEETCLQQAVNSAMAPGVNQVVVNPDAHLGYGAPVGCVMVSDKNIYPGPVGVDIKCSMSLLQLDLEEAAIEEREVRRRIIHAICQRIPTGMGKGRGDVPKGRGRINKKLGEKMATEGASLDVMTELGIPPEWAERCEDSKHGDVNRLKARLWHLCNEDSVGRHRIGDKFEQKMSQVGSLGGGNHFGECEVVEIQPGMEEVAEKFGLKTGKLAFLTHCGSRGFGHNLADRQFRYLKEFFQGWGLPFPANDHQLVYAPVERPEGQEYIDDMSLGANFATVNHMLINQLVHEAFAEVFPGVKAELVYFISHNIARQELVDRRMQWVHRKGATRAFPAKHPGLKHTPFYYTGHPILLPGNPLDGSAVMVAQEGAEKSCFSVNHGAGRAMGRRAAKQSLDQKTTDNLFDQRDVLTNCRQYPLDEAPKAYKDFKEVIKSVETAGLASTVAKLRARFVIKDADKADD